MLYGTLNGLDFHVRETLRRDLIEQRQLKKMEIRPSSNCRQLKDMKIEIYT